MQIPEDYSVAAAEYDEEFYDLALWDPVEQVWELRGHEWDTPERALEQLAVQRRLDPEGRDPRRWRVVKVERATKHTEVPE